VDFYTGNFAVVLPYGKHRMPMIDERFDGAVGVSVFFGRGAEHHGFLLFHASKIQKWHFADLFLTLD
jgi:hypothetical protein